MLGGLLLLLLAALGGCDSKPAHRGGHTHGGLWDDLDDNEYRHEIEDEYEDEYEYEMEDEDDYEF